VTCFETSSPTATGVKNTQCKPSVLFASQMWLGSAANVAKPKPQKCYRLHQKICIEVILPSNTPSEIAEKIGLYLEAGVLEVWTCDLSGQMTFHGVDGTLLASMPVPNFPGTVNVD
jgi:hypothetical protein